MMETDLTTEVLERVLETKVGIGSVRVEGAVRTRKPFLEWICSHVRGSESFGTVLEQLTVAIEGLRESDAFEGVEAFLDLSKEGEGLADVVLTVKEKNRTSLSFGTQSGGTVEVCTYSKQRRRKREKEKDTEHNSDSCYSFLLPLHLFLPRLERIFFHAHDHSKKSIFRLVIS